MVTVTMTVPPNSWPSGHNQTAMRHGDSDNESATKQLAQWPESAGGSWVRILAVFLGSNSSSGAQFYLSAFHGQMYEYTAHTQLEARD